MTAGTESLDPQAPDPHAPDPRATGGPYPAGEPPAAHGSSAAHERSAVETAHPGVPTAPAVAGELFGARFPLAVRYADLLASRGVAHGHLGPREVERLWPRHLLNSVLLGRLVPPGARVVDVGSGAGLPGIPLAISRPDLRLDLVEPMQRRTDFLDDVVGQLGLSEQVRVIRGRAEDRAVHDRVGGARWVTARAVAPLGRLVGWCVPLLAPDGEVLALKGASAAGEAGRDAALVARAGARVVSIATLGGAEGIDPTQVVRIARRRGGGGARQ